MNACSVHFGAQTFAFFVVGMAAGALLIVGIDLWLRRKARKLTEIRGKPASDQR